MFVYELCYGNNIVYHIAPNCKKNRWKISLSKATFGKIISTKYSFVQSTGEHWSVKLSQQECSLSAFVYFLAHDTDETLQTILLVKISIV